MKISLELSASSLLQGKDEGVRQDIILIEKTDNPSEVLYIKLTLSCV
jgi:hypothetical protein